MYQTDGDHLVRLLRPRSAGLPKPAKGHQIPSCIVEIAGADAVQTEGVKKTQDPTWNTRFRFNDLHLDGPVLRFSVKVVERSREISRADFEQPLDSPAPGLQLDLWIELTGEGALAGGRLHVGISIISYEEAPREGAPQGEAADGQEEEEGSKPNKRTQLLWTKLQHDCHDPEQVERDAKADAAKKYRAFLRSRTPLLLENAEKAKEIRGQAESK